MKRNILIVFFYFFLSVIGFTEALNSILIQAEDFTSYYDTSPGNYDLIYRQDVDVDINYDHDPYWYEGIRVMAIQTGERLTYTFTVPAADIWDITFNGIINFDLYFDGDVEPYASDTGTPLDYRGDFRYNQDILVSSVPLSAGTHTMTIISNSLNDFGDVQLDYIWFASSTDPPDAPQVSPKPYDDTAPPETPPGYVSPVSRYGRLYVDRPHVKSTITGENVHLRFVALSCPKWFPTIRNNTIYNLAYHENIQGIRLAMYAEYGTYDDPYLRPYLQEKTLEIINECIDAGIYLEISYHTHASDFEIGGTAYDIEMDFYNWLLAQPVVADRPPNLIFGIINEIASEDIRWNTAKPYAQDFVDLIRTTHPDSLILCGTPVWSQDPREVIGNELAGSNIVYTFHMYTAQHQMSIADNVITCYDAGIPLWANEISPGHYDWTTWSYNFENFYRLLYILETRCIPWTNWAWTLKGEALSALYWNSRYYGPWKNSDLTEGGIYTRNMINNCLVNTDFSNGTDGWYLNAWQKPAEVEFLDEEAHIFYPYGASSDYYGQQFTLENIKIVKGITYTVGFDARSSGSRNVHVDVTENGDDYTTYGSSGSLDVSIVQNHYTFCFEMNEATDESARIVFNAGASEVDIWLDGITIQYSELPTPGSDRDDIDVLHENFSEPADWIFNPWQPVWPSAEIEYANDEAHITFSALAEDPWGQQLSKSIILEQGASYIVRFDARSVAQRPLQVTIANKVTYENHGADDFTLSTNMAPYSFSFTMTAQATGDEIIQFNLGSDVHDIWLDNVRVIKYNRLLNGGFSVGNLNWNFNPWEAPAEIEYTNNQAHITFQECAPHDYGQQLSGNLRLETGESYTVSFDAKSTAPRPLKVLITNGSYYYPADFDLSVSMKHYTYSFIMDAEATDHDIIRFDLGTDTCDTWLDNVVVRRSENLIGNGFFSNNLENWLTGFHEGACGNVQVVNGEYVVDITSGGTEDWHVQTLQTNLRLNRGKRYYVGFDARTNTARDVVVNIGSGAYPNPEPYTSYSGAKIFSLDAEMRRYSFEFRMNQPDHHDARCEFNLGLFDRDVIIDNVRVIEIIEISDDFEAENDPGNWQGNGENCYWNTIEKNKYSIRGMNIQDADGKMELTNGFDASGARMVKIDFSYCTLGYKDESRYNWEVEFTQDGGITWDTIFTWNDKKLRDMIVYETVILTNSDYHFTWDCNIRFRSEGKNKNDDVYIGDVVISVY